MNKLEIVLNTKKAINKLKNIFSILMVVSGLDEHLFTIIEVALQNAGFNGSGTHNYDINKEIKEMQNMCVLFDNLHEYHDHQYTGYIKEHYSNEISAMMMSLDDLRKDEIYAEISSYDDQEFVGNDPSMPDMRDIDGQPKTR